jgi:hypothetical protein
MERTLSNFLVPFGGPIAHHARSRKRVPASSRGISRKKKQLLPVCRLEDDESIVC